MPCCANFPEVAKGAGEGAGDVRKPGEIAVIKDVGREEEGYVNPGAEKGGEVGKVGEAMGVAVMEGGGEGEEGRVEGGDGGRSGVLHCGVLCQCVQNMTM